MCVDSCCELSTNPAPRKQKTENAHLVKPARSKLNENLHCFKLLVFNINWVVILAEEDLDFVLKYIWIFFDD